MPADARRPTSDAGAGSPAAWPSYSSSVTRPSRAAPRAPAGRPATGAGAAARRWRCPALGRAVGPQPLGSRSPGRRRPGAPVRARRHSAAAPTASQRRSAAGRAEDPDPARQRDVVVRRAPSRARSPRRFARDSWPAPPASRSVTSRSPPTAAGRQAARPIAERHARPRLGPPESLHDRGRGKDGGERDEAMARPGRARARTPRVRPTRTRLAPSSVVGPSGPGRSSRRRRPPPGRRASRRRRRTPSPASRRSTSAEFDRQRVAQHDEVDGPLGRLVLEAARRPPAGAVAVAWPNLARPARSRTPGNVRGRDGRIPRTTGRGGRRRRAASRERTPTDAVAVRRGLGAATATPPQRRGDHAAPPARPRRGTRRRRGRPRPAGRRSRSPRRPPPRPGTP